MPHYSASVQDYFSRPAAQPGRQVSGEAGSMGQGIWVRFGMDAEAGQMRNVGFRAFACPHIIAACQRVAELLEGAPLEDLGAIDTESLLQEFEIPVEKMGKLLILKDALLACQQAEEVLPETSGHD